MPSPSLKEVSPPRCDTIPTKRLCQLLKPDRHDRLALPRQAGAAPRKGAARGKLVGRASSNGPSQFSVPGRPNDPGFRDLIGET
jgi:hypothetical protein